MFAICCVGDGEVGRTVAGFYELAVSALDGRYCFSRIELYRGGVIVEDSKEFGVFPLSGIHYIAVYIAGGVRIT